MCPVEPESTQVRACVALPGGGLENRLAPLSPPGEGQVQISCLLGGICGSDLHYWREGRVGDFALREPMVLGHEVVGVVTSVGPGSEEVREGSLVAVHPASVCGRCRPCLSGRANLCDEVRYLGSAARLPHVQGAFRTKMSVPKSQVVPLPEGLDARRAVLAEPLAVAAHAAHRAGDLLGRKVVVVGAGPIGTLCAAVAARAGASEVSVIDLVPEALEVAASVGATKTYLASDSGLPSDADVAIESSGSSSGLGSALGAVRKGGRVVLIGLAGGPVPLAGSVAVTREVELVGSFRFHEEFQTALQMLATGLPVDDVVTTIAPLAEAQTAFEIAADRSRSCKVLLDLQEV